MYGRTPNDPSVPKDYGSIQLGVKKLDDATIKLGNYNKIENYTNLGNKAYVLRALANRDGEALRAISDQFFRTNGIYQRVCCYFATMYRQDWYIAAETYSEKPNEKKITKDFQAMLKYLDDSYIKKTCAQIALSVIKYGCYYGYVVEAEDGFVLQELPIKYCRSRYFKGPLPAIEFDMRWFDIKYPDPIYRMKVLGMFPKEFKKGYQLYKEGKIPVEHDGCGRMGAWQLLDQGATVKFDFGLGSGDLPLFASAIPELIDLDAAQDLDRRKQLQKLLKIFVQKLPRDKNGDLIFDLDEAKDLHNNAVQMLINAIGVDVLTTPTDVEAIDISDDNTTASNDDLSRVERTVYNAFGTPQSIFNSTGNVALANSILNDEAYVKTMVLQFSSFFDRLIRAKGKKDFGGKKYNFRFFMLETTQYNYKELSKLYKEQTQLGFSKCLPQIALGHSQSMILNTITFENEVLNLPAIMIPPLMSSTMNIETIKEVGSKGTKLMDEGGANEGAGRPEKADTEKSDKTIANRESMG